jgi:hypothetical protein
MQYGSLWSRLTAFLLLSALALVLSGI